MTGGRAGNGSADSALEGRLRAAAAARFAASSALPRDYFAAEAGRIARACLAMARRFHRGGRLLALAAGNAVTDAQHVSVEFVHPVIVGKRALPAIALGTDVAATLGLAGGEGWRRMYARQVTAVGRPADIALGIDGNGRDEAVAAGLAAARDQGLLTLALSGGDGGALARQALDYCFVVPAADAALVQEVHETLYHVLWELVHVFFEHEALLDGEVTG